MNLKYIKEYNEENNRNYEYIKNCLVILYEINVSSTDLEEFERTKFYNESVTDSEYIKKFVNYYMGVFDDELLGEDVACVTAGSVSGMGAVVSPQAGAVPGTTGTTGSGDIGSGWSQSINNNKNIRSRDNFLPRSRRKNKAKAALKMRKKTSDNVPFDVSGDNQVDFKEPKKATLVKSFSDFVKKSK